MRKIGRYKRNLSRPGETCTRWVSMWWQMPRRRKLWRFFTSIMIQLHEWGHQNDLNQPSQAQGIFNLAVVAYFGGIAFPWLQKWAVYTHFTTTSPRRERKAAPFWWKSRFWTKNPANAGETKKTKSRRKGVFFGQKYEKQTPSTHFLISTFKHDLN